MSIWGRVTMRTLRCNRTRTIVTIIGVLLSAAMFTAVTTSISSLQDYLRRCAVYQEGDWHVYLEGVPADDRGEVIGDSLVEGAAFAQELGYAAFDTGEVDRPYLHVLGGDAEFYARMPVHLVEGRLPENSGEVVLPLWLWYRIQEGYALGDTLTLELGDRYLGDELLCQHNPYMGADAENPEAETLRVRETRSFTVVGVCDEPAFEDYASPGYPVLTAWDDNAADSVLLSSWLRLSEPKAAFDFAAGEPIDGQTHYTGWTLSSQNNSDLLMAEGFSRYDTFYETLYGMAAILCLIILLGSVSLIYNAFSISVAERTQQFGILSSVGATRPQLRRLVLNEALLVSVVGIPLGLLAGVAGIGVTLRIIGTTFSELYVREVPFYLVVRPAALLCAAAVALVTVLLSAWVPSRRATKVTAIDAIRQSGEGAIRRREVRTSPITGRLFGLEGLLARKHFKRDRRRCRSTILSLFMSVVLFISASSFCSYMTDSVTGTFETYDHDISCSWMARGEDALTVEQLRAVFGGVEGIQQMSFIVQESGGWPIPVSQIPEASRQRLNGPTEDETLSTNYTLLGVDEETYRQYLRRQHLSPEVYLDSQQPKAVVLAKSKMFSPQAGRMEILDLLERDTDAITLELTDADRLEALLAERDTDAMTEEDWEQVYQEVTTELTLPVGAIVDELPFGLNSSEYWGIYVVLPMSYVQSIPGIAPYGTAYFEAPDYQAVLERLTEAAEDAGLSLNFRNCHEGEESNRNLITVVKVFAYGFITLISLIAAANVFNTISTNLMLRRREFAMLRSVGMAEGGIRRMLNYECLLYGGKSLLLGLPAAAAVTYLIYRSVGAAYDTAFYIPWNAVVIAAVSVFLVVFAAMLYSMAKLRRDNLIDTLRNENQ